MADPVLHIKDSYYFEVPKVLCPSSFKSRTEFPEVWVKLDPEFQDWEFERQYRELDGLNAGLPEKGEAKLEWQHWVHADHANFAKPFDEFLEAKYQAHLAAFAAWKEAKVEEAMAAKDDAKLREAKELKLDDYLKTDEAIEKPYAHFSELRSTALFQGKWSAAKKRAGDVTAYKADSHLADWSKAKIDAYNGHLSGKILIPQPFNPDLRNMYERDSGFAISKFLVIEVFVGLMIVLVFAALARRISHGQPARGKLWNLLEVFLVFIRDQIAKPVLGAHDHGHSEEHADKDHGHDAHAAHGHAAAHGHGHAHTAHVLTPDQKFLPLLWTIFFFVLGCNLMGMLPWAGSPTAAFGVTLAMALITLLTGVAAGMMQFGFVGFFLNQIPGMDLPWYMAIIIKPMIFFIELGGLLIKHGVLAVRLLANMVAGHLVILGIMGLAFGVDAAAKFTAPGVAGWQWVLTAVIAVVASAAFNILELFVAFLQAYIITFLSALFIGASIHKH